MTDQIQQSPQKTLAKMIGACQFRNVDPDFQFEVLSREIFPSSDPVTNGENVLALTVMELAGQCIVGTDLLEAGMERKGYRHASLIEHLIYAKTNWNRRDMICTLSSSPMDHSDYRLVTTIGENDDGTYISFFWDSPGIIWSDDDLILVARR